jgi:ATP-dependent Clp protease adaptor protein ClpS
MNCMPAKSARNADRSAAAVAELPFLETPAAETPPQEKRSSRKPKKLPPYAVVVLNDDLHTFEYMIETFMKVFGYPAEKCFQLATDIHVQGRSIVWSGAKEVAELKRDQIRSAGPDFHASRKVEFPPGVEIEPLPG